MTGSLIPLCVFFNTLVYFARRGHLLGCMIIWLQGVEVSSSNLPGRLFFTFTCHCRIWKLKLNISVEETPVTQVELSKLVHGSAY